MWQRKILVGLLLFVVTLCFYWVHAISSAVATLSAGEESRTVVTVGNVITVTTTADAITVNGDCTLMEAIQAAAGDKIVDGCAKGSGADTIYLPAGLYEVGHDGGDFQSGRILLTGVITLQGSLTGTTTLDAGGRRRVLEIATGAIVTLRRLEITGGVAHAEDCDGCYGGDASGGGILNFGTTWIVDSIIHHNRTGISASNPYDAQGAPGGGINNSGILTVTNSTISSNVAGDGSQYGLGHADTYYCSPGGSGGGIANFGMLTLENSTLANNATGKGGPLEAYDRWPDCSPSADGMGGGLYNYEFASVSLKNSIITGNEANDCGGLLISLGNNVIEGSAGCTVSGDYLNWPANLEELHDNGGATLTHALSRNSPAIDAGSCTDSGGHAVTVDQRGEARPQGAGCDIGAFESPYTATFKIRDTVLPAVAFRPSPCIKLDSPCNLTNSPDNEIDPAWSPDGRLIAFTHFAADTGIFVVNAEGGEPVKIVDKGAGPVWSPDGSKIAFTCCYDAGTPYNIYLVNADGSQLTNLTNRNDLYFQRPVWSPDGSKILFSTCCSGTVEGNLFVINADGSHLIMLTANVSYSSRFAWSPDSSKITYLSSIGIMVMEADGSNPVQLTHNTPGGTTYDGPPVWSPVANKIAFARAVDPSRSNGDLYLINADGTQLIQLTEEDGYESDLLWSMDGSKLLYKRAGSTYTINADGSQQKLATSFTYEGQPAWSPDARKLAVVAFHAGHREIFIVGLEE